MITGARLWEWCSLDRPVIVLRGIDSRVHAGQLKDRLAGFDDVAMEISASLDRISDTDYSSELTASDIARLLLQHAEDALRRHG